MKDDQGQDTHWCWSVFFALIMGLVVVNILNQALHLMR